MIANRNKAPVNELVRANAFPLPDWRLFACAYQKDSGMKTLTLAAATLVAGMSLALAQSATHQPPGAHGTVGVQGGGMAFTPEHGAMIRQHATGQHHQSFQDQGFQVQVGATLPGSAQLHPLPDGLVTQMPSVRSHQYSIVNDRYVIVDPSTRRVTHAFE